jgi:hypothetical protein
MSTPSGKPIQPLGEFSAYAPKGGREQPAAELPPVANDVDAYLRRLASSSEREGADHRLPRAVQLSPVTGLPPVEETAGAEKVARTGETFINGLLVPSSLERLRPPPPMRRYRDNLIAPLLMIGCVVAVLIAFLSMGNSIRERWRGPKLASLDSRIDAPPLAAVALAAAPTDSAISSPSAIIPQVKSTVSAQSPASQGAKSSQGATPSQSEAPSQGETTAMLSLGPSGVQTPPTSKDVRRLDPEDIKLLMKRGEQYTAAGDLATARLVFQRAAEAGDATAALSMGATYDPIVLAKLGVLGMSADVGKARSWYEKAKELGSPEASRRLELLANR